MQVCCLGAGPETCFAGFSSALAAVLTKEVSCVHCKGVSSHSSNISVNSQLTEHAGGMLVSL